MARTPSRPIDFVYYINETLTRGKRLRNENLSGRHRPQYLSVPFVPKSPLYSSWLITLVLMQDLGYGKGYRLAHYEQDKVAADMQCLPDSLVGAEYYAPTREGREGLFADRLAELKELRTRRRSSGE